MQGKVENCKLTFERENSFGKKNYHFLVKFDGNDQKYVHVSSKEYAYFKVGETVEYEQEFKEDGTTPQQAQANEKTWLPKIKPIKEQKAWGGGGGAKYTPPTKEQELNKFLGTVTSYAKDLVCHRTTLGGKTEEEAADAVVRITNRIFDGLKDRIQ